MKRILIAVFLLVTACVPAAPAAGTPQLIKINASAAAQPWLVKSYNCADNLGLILSQVNDPKQADILIQIGEPAGLISPAYQIDKEDLLVVTNRESPLQNMSTDMVRSLFSRPDDPGLQVWVFASGSDIQEVFEHDIMDGQVVTSLARMALSPQQMSDTLNQEKNSVGILPRHWKAGTVRDIFTLSRIPVLAITKTEPQGMIKSLLACLQNNQAK